MRSDEPNSIDAPGSDEPTWRAWPGLGRLPAADLTLWRSAVVLAAHPDDEVLGVGGTMSVLASAGARLRLVSVTDGEASHPGTARPDLLAERRVAETAAALHRLGAQDTEVIRLRLPDTGLAAIQDEITELLRGLIAGFDVCIAPWEKDVHADHEAVGRAAKRTAGRGSQQVVSYPVWTWHWSFPDDPRVPWHRGLRVQLPAAVASSKRAAIRCFASQLENRAADCGPVLSAGTIAHFTRDLEVLFR